MKWVKRLAILVVWAVSIFYVFGVGALVGKYSPQMAERPMAFSAKFLVPFLGDYKPCEATGALGCGYQDTTDRTEVECSDYQTGRSAVLMTFGQSNSANAGADRYIPVEDVANFNFHDGKCYKAEDPLLGPDGPGGSVWGVLADKLIRQGAYDRVLLFPFGIGGSALEQWQSDGFLHPILEKATEAARQRGINPTHVLWHQGESDAQSGTSQEQYYSMFEALLQSLRDYGIAAPVYPAIATHCEMTYLKVAPEYEQGRTTVRAAQMQLPQLEGVFAGPDTDALLGADLRPDNCHFDAKGMQAHAELWLRALTVEGASGARSGN